MLPCPEIVAGIIPHDDAIGCGTLFFSKFHRTVNNGNKNDQQASIPQLFHIRQDMGLQAPCGYMGNKDGYITLQDLPRFLDNNMPRPLGRMFNIVQLTKRIGVIRFFLQGLGQTRQSQRNIGHSLGQKAQMQGGITIIPGQCAGMTVNCQGFVEKTGFFQGMAKLHPDIPSVGIDFQTFFILGNRA
nr:hypothetical protein [Komagataeibacter rhaeticus]